MKIITARIQSILKRFPDVERIFEWYEIELTEETKLLRLEDACERFQIEAEDIVLDLEEASEHRLNAILELHNLSRTSAIPCSI